jgi:hypothetical protein
LSILSFIINPLGVLFYAFCPQCKTVYNLGEFVEPVNQPLGEGLKKLAVVGLVIAVLDALTAKPKKKSRGRR